MSATTPCLLNSAGRSRPESVGPAQETLYRKGIALDEGHAMSSECTALGSRLEIIANSGDERLAFTEPGTEAAGPPFCILADSCVLPEPCVSSGEGRGSVGAGVGDAEGPARVTDLVDRDDLRWRPR
jgi:hypothetical protein